MPHDVQVAVCCMSDDRGVLRRVQTMRVFARITASGCHAPHIERQIYFQCVQAVRTHTARRTPSNGRSVFVACWQCGHMPQIPCRMPCTAVGRRVCHRFGGRVIDGHPVAAACCGGQERERFGVRYFRREGEALRGDPRLPGNIRRRCVTGRRGRTTACPFPEWPPKEGAGKLPVCRFGSAAGKGETDRTNRESGGGTARAETAAGTTSARGSAADTPHRTA